MLCTRSSSFSDYLMIKETLLALPNNLGLTELTYITVTQPPPSTHVRQEYSFNCLANEIGIIT